MNLQFQLLKFDYFYVFCLSNMKIDQKSDASPSAVGNYNMYFPLLYYISSTSDWLINQGKNRKL